VSVTYTPEALADLDNLLDYLADKNPHAQMRVRARLKSCLELLERYPQIGQTTSRISVRRMVVSPYPYLIFYKMMENEVVILAFRHAARKTQL